MALPLLAGIGAATGLYSAITGSSEAKKYRKMQEQMLQYQLPILQNASEVAGLMAPSNRTMGLALQGFLGNGGGVPQSMQLDRNAMMNLSGINTAELVQRRQNEINASRSRSGLMGSGFEGDQGSVADAYNILKSKEQSNFAVANQQNAQSWIQWLSGYLGNTVNAGGNIAANNAQMYGGMANNAEAGVANSLTGIGSAIGQYLAYNANPVNRPQSNGVGIGRGIDQSVPKNPFAPNPAAFSGGGSGVNFGAGGTGVRTLNSWQPASFAPTGGFQLRGIGG